MLPSLLTLKSLFVYSVFTSIREMSVWCFRSSETLAHLLHAQGQGLPAAAWLCVGPRPHHPAPGGVTLGP